VRASTVEDGNLVCEAFGGEVTFGDRGVRRIAFYGLDARFGARAIGEPQSAIAEPASDLEDALCARRRRPRAEERAIAGGIDCAIAVMLLAMAMRGSQTW
jgi:hypothetical protein